MRTQRGRGSRATPVVIKDLGHSNKGPIVRGRHPRENFGREHAPGLIRREAVRRVADVRHRLDIGKIKLAHAIDVRHDLGQIVTEGLDAIGRKLEARQACNALNFRGGNGVM